MYIHGAIRRARPLDKIGWIAHRVAQEQRKEENRKKRKKTEAVVRGSGAP